MKYMCLLTVICYIQSFSATKKNVFTREENEATKLLESYNIQVTIKPELNINCVVIDKAIIWYGGISILGYHSVSENIMTSIVLRQRTAL